jgi:hypothetical protein
MCYAMQGNAPLWRRRFFNNWDMIESGTSEVELSGGLDLAFRLSGARDPSPDPFAAGVAS